MDSIHFMVKLLLFRAEIDGGTSQLLDVTDYLTPYTHFQLEI
jgi:hypothetical protein